MCKKINLFSLRTYFFCLFAVLFCFSACADEVEKKQDYVVGRSGDTERIEKTIKEFEKKAFSVADYRLIKTDIERSSVVSENEKRAFRKRLETAYLIQIRDSFAHYYKYATNSEEFAPFEKELNEFAELYKGSVRHISEPLADYKALELKIAEIYAFSRKAYKENTASLLRYEVEEFLSKSPLRENAHYAELAAKAFKKIEAHEAARLRYQEILIKNEPCDCDIFKEFPFYAEECRRLQKEFR